MLRMNGFARTSKEKKLMSFCINDEMLLEKYKTIWKKFEELKGVKLSTFYLIIYRCQITMISI